MIRRLRYALTMVGDIAKIICPASAYVRTRVDEVRDADVLTECEAETEVWEGYRLDQQNDIDAAAVDSALARIGN